MGALRKNGADLKRRLASAPSALWQSEACGRNIRRFHHGLPEASRPRSQPDRGPPVAGRLSAGRRRIVSGTRPDGIFFAALLKKTPRGRHGGRVAHGRQRNAGKREAPFCPKNTAERNTAEILKRRISAEERRVHARNRSRKQREKGTQKKRSSASSPGRDRISRRRLGGRLPGRPSSPDTKCLRHGERLQPLPDVNPARGGRGHAWLRRSSRRRGKSGGGRSIRSDISMFEVCYSY